MHVGWNKSSTMTFRKQWGHSQQAFEPNSNLPEKKRRFSHEFDNLFGRPRRRSLVRSFVFWSAVTLAFVTLEKTQKTVEHHYGNSETRYREQN